MDEPKVGEGGSTATDAGRIHLVRPGGRIWSFEDPVASRLGWDLARVQGEPFQGLVHPADRERALEALDQVGGEAPSVRLRLASFLGPDGSMRYEPVRARVEPSAFGDADHVVVLHAETSRTEADALEARWRTLLASHPDHILEVSTDGEILDINRLASGDAPDQVIGAPVTSLVPPEHRPTVEGAHERALRDREQTLFTLPFRIRDGEERTYEARAAPVVVHDRVDRVLYTVRDVTARERAERERDDMAGELEAYMDASPDVFFRADPATSRILWLSPGIEPMLGWTPDRWVGKPFTDLLHPEDRETALTEAARAFAGESLSPTEYRALTAQGSYRSVSALGRPVPGPEGEPELVGIVRDIEPHKRTERELALFHRLVIDLAASDDLRSGLRSALSSLGETTGSSFAEAWVPTDDGRRIQVEACWARDRDSCQPLLEASEGLAFDAGVDLPGRVLATGAPVTSEDLGTDRRVVRRELAREHGLSTAVGLPATVGGTVVAVVVLYREDELPSAQQIETLVSACTKLAPVIQRHQREARRASYTRDLERSLDGLERGGARAGDVRCTSRSTDAAVVARQAVERLAHRVDRSGAIFEIPDGPQVDMDPASLRFVFEALFSNALRYSGDRPPRVEVSFERTGATVEILVRDRGIGIDPIDHERVFDLFYQVDPGHSPYSHGTGLTLARRLLEQAGGTIRAEPADGPGVAFRVSLPARS